jgi:flagellar biosynthesis protein
MKKRSDIVNGSTDIAVALHYDGEQAPRVTATGKHAMAERIIARAEEAGVPLYPDTELALILSQVPMGDEIPDNLYKAIAEVIAFAYLLAGKFPEGFEAPTAKAADRDAPAG